MRTPARTNLNTLFHSIADLTDERHRGIWEALVKRKTFFSHIEVLMNYHVYESWDDLFCFMFEGLELNKPENDSVSVAWEFSDYAEMFLCSSGSF